MKDTHDEPIPARTPERVLSDIAIGQVVNTAIGIPRDTINMAHWADEAGEDIEPRPYLEAFYTLIAMQYGDPELGPWLRLHINDVRDAYDHYTKMNPQVPRDDENAVVLSYIFWYQRNRPT